jgi:streptogrisin D
MLGCASGYPGAEEASLSLPAFGALDGGTAGAAGGGGAGGSAGGGGSAGEATLPEMPGFTGEMCFMGQSEACTCEDGVSMGTKSCKHEASSPTMGAFGACEACQAPPMSAGAGGDAEAGAGGDAEAGAGGSGEEAGAGGSGEAGAGSGGSGEAGAGAGGSGEAGDGGDSCDPRQCPRPLFGTACCTRSGECGSRLLLTCN